MNERIKEIREVLKLSQEEFGKRIGITRAAISNIEKGIRNPSEQTIKFICKEYKINQNWLKSGIGEMFSNDQDIFLDDLTELNSLGETYQKIKNCTKLKSKRVW